MKEKKNRGKLSWMDTKRKRMPSRGEGMPAEDHCRTKPVSAIARRASFAQACKTIK